MFNPRKQFLFLLVAAVVGLSLGFYLSRPAPLVVREFGAVHRGVR